MKEIELLAPGGSFDSAMAAFEGGADAIYCGLPAFSARKGAKNLSFSELARLKLWALNHSKKIYVAINTVLKDSELPLVIEYLQEIQNLKIDALIIQDLGLLYICQNYFPSIECHGSTQMSTHNSPGVSFLKKQGLSRVLVPREMTIKEINAIHQENPQIELEAFIHGAQCYGFSGLCLASGMTLNRSANRGACAQICRTWFNFEKEKGYFLSCNDLAAGENIIKMKEAGVSSFKIEGRMKSPSYAFSVSSYYRGILDGQLNREEILDLKKESQIAFSRRPITGHLLSKKGSDMINPEYPSHMGYPIGKVISSNKNKLNIKTFESIAPRDGLMFIQKGRSISFSAKDIKKNKNGEISLQSPSTLPGINSQIYQVQSHNMHWKTLKEGQFKPFKPEYKLFLKLEKNLLICNSDLYSKKIPIIAENSNKDNLAKKIEQEFSKTGEYPFSFKLNLEGFEKKFITPGALKKIRQEIYKAFERAKIEDSLNKRCQLIKKIDDLSPLEVVKAPLRQILGPKNQRIPYHLESNLTQDLAKLKNKIIMLPPLLFPEDLNSYISTLQKTVSSNESVIYGLNSLAHIELFLTGKLPGAQGWIIDYGIYVANKVTILFLQEVLKNKPCHGIFSWIEEPTPQIIGWTTLVEKDFAPPLFISRNCFKKHSLNKSCIDCIKNETYLISQKGVQYEALIENCLTWIFKKEPG